MKLKVLILGYGEMGHAMEYLLAERHDIRIWSLDSKSILEEEAANAQVILFCLPANAHQEIIRRVAPHLAQASLCLTIAKGLDNSGQTASQTFSNVLLKKQHYGVIYGPMISEEIKLGRYAFADVALSNADDFLKLRNLFEGSTLICRLIVDMTGSSWSVILKNVYAIMFGIADELKLGDNMRGHLMVTALAELSAIGKLFGAEENTPYCYPGLGDLVTTATSKNSHHHELGRMLVLGQFADISGEGIHTLQMVKKFQLFEVQKYPLFALINDIVSAPNDLKVQLDTYLGKLRQW